ncbi:MAG TPA: phage/plasmid primase, P4 family, partial [Candidatus Methanoperedens sp.]|nr:phage/plasmid primase, P4 family [Candidatus Methanoperedens sp.]
MKNKGVPASKEAINELTGLLIKLYHIKTMKDTDQVMVYIDGYYHLDGEKDIRSEVNQVFQDNYTSKIFGDILDKIQASTTISRAEFQEPLNKINLKNGVLDIRSKGLDLHNPDFNFLYKLNIDYNPAQDCPAIKQFLHEVTANENDYQCLQEYIGYTLLSGYPFRVFLVLYGSGANGKSIFIYLIRNFIGEDNVSVVSLQQLQADRFAPARLYGKKANVFADIPPLKMKSTDIIKSLTGFTDKISGEKKFKDTFEFVNGAKLIFSANQLPQVDDETDAFWNRVILIDFPNKFEGKKDDKELIKKLTTREELSGLLNFALQGLDQLLKNGRFTYDHDTTYERWQKNTEVENPVQDFMEKCIETRIDALATKEALYDAYVVYCHMVTKPP